MGGGVVDGVTDAAAVGAAGRKALFSVLLSFADESPQSSALALPSAGGVIGRLTLPPVPMSLPAPLTLPSPVHSRAGGPIGELALFATRALTRRL